MNELATGARCALSHADAMRAARAVQGRLVNLRCALVEPTTSTVALGKPKYDAALRTIFIPRGPVDLEDLELALTRAAGQGLRGRRAIRALLAAELAQ